MVSVIAAEMGTQSYSEGFSLDKQSYYLRFFPDTCTLHVYYICEREGKHI